ncbi:methyltransferase family protein [Dinoroseobacter sp. S124A]|uniref:methyltransferase family protein n=1 Tax=Dinoroseobacter sp. S124A TaxID=3415128 RepID=UPI003C7BE181
MTSSDTPLFRMGLALTYGAVCHGIFALAGLAMLVGLFTGMQSGFGAVPQPYAWIANLVLLAQFPLAHSALLTPRGRRVLARLAPAPHGQTLATTVYATIASLQLLLLFTLWTPSGVVLWRAEGVAFWVLCLCYGGSWLLLTKASFDAGPTVQSGSLGWMALLRGQRPVFPDMPERGLFRVVRQPIYVAFALTLWCVPVWTPDQLLVATVYTAYCVTAPRFKEQRFLRIYGDRFRAYQARVPYWIPGGPRRGRTDA